MRQDSYCTFDIEWTKHDNKHKATLVLFTWMLSYDDNNTGMTAAVIYDDGTCFTQKEWEMTYTHYPHEFDDCAGFEWYDWENEADSMIVDGLPRYAPKSQSGRDGRHFAYGSPCAEKNQEETNKLYDRCTPITLGMELPCKPQLCKPSNLLDASTDTSFRYRVEDGFFSDAPVDHIRFINDYSHWLINKESHIVALGCENDIFKRNLRMLDGCMEQLLGALLLESLCNASSKINVLTESLARKNPLQINSANTYNVYKFKIKNFLVSVALGMMPSKEWNGVYEANGGYIIVRDNGELLCYHFYDRNRFADYLFNYTSLERASSTRHKYATLYREGDSVFFNLNLQIRFK